MADRFVAGVGPCGGEISSFSLLILCVRVIRIIIYEFENVLERI